MQDGAEESSGHGVVSSSRSIIILAIIGLLACALYWNIYRRVSATGTLHPAQLHITKRPLPAQRDPAQLFQERGLSQVAILLTNSVQNAESPTRCLNTMGIPFFVTRDLTSALRHKLDRKSTRLNSSHQIISYAVFCLKKKKQTRTLTSTLS